MQKEKKEKVKGARKIDWLYWSDRDDVTFSYSISLVDIFFDITYSFCIFVFLSMTFYTEPDHAAG